MKVSKFAKQEKKIINFIDDMRFATFEEVRLHCMADDREWYKSLNDVLNKGMVRKILIDGQVKYCLPA